MIDPEYIPGTPEWIARREEQREELHDASPLGRLEDVEGAIGALYAQLDSQQSMLSQLMARVSALEEA